VYSISSPFAPIDFPVGQAPPQRQQVNSFVMNSWGSIEYVWQIQFGVKVNVDDPARSALPRVFLVNQVNGTEVEIGSLEGTFWFNPGDEVKVASAANVTTDPTSLALSGWISGDGFYFSSSGDINSQDGDPDRPAAPGRVPHGPVALWENSFFAANGRQYRGLSIPSLRRPARVLWTYGEQVYQDTVRIGEYMCSSAGRPCSMPIPRWPPWLSRADQISAAQRRRQQSECRRRTWPSGTRTPSGSIRWCPASSARPGRGDGDTVQCAGGRVAARSTALSAYRRLAAGPIDARSQRDLLFQGTEVHRERCRHQRRQPVHRRTARPQRYCCSAKSSGSAAAIPRNTCACAWFRPGNGTSLGPCAATAVIGQAIRIRHWTSPARHRLHQVRAARYNPNVYDAGKTRRLTAREVYDMDLLRSTGRRKDCGESRGPARADHSGEPASRRAAEQRIVVVWYYDPALTDEILWPHAARTYLPRWPQNEAEGLGRIVIASQFGSESVNARLVQDQLVRPA
jgi:hypothetical protein